MRKLYKEAMIFKDKKMLIGLKQMIDTFEQAKADGRSENDPEVRGRVEDKLTLMMERLRKDIELLDRRQGDSRIPCWDFSAERKMNSFAEDEEIVLRPLQEQNRDLYIQVKKENSYAVLKPKEEQEKHWKETWEGTKDEKRFVLEVIPKRDGEFAGYVAINDTTQPLWEVCIELLNDKLGKGYGTRAIMLFVDKLYEITGFEEYRALVEPDNIRSQRMMKHINAKLLGVVDYYFSDQKEAAAFEEEHLDMIDDNITDIAARLGVEPRKLISRVLEYRIKRLQ